MPGTGTQTRETVKGKQRKRGAGKEDMLHVGRAFVEDAMRKWCVTYLKKQQWPAMWKAGDSLLSRGPARGRSVGQMCWGWPDRQQAMAKGLDFIPATLGGSRGGTGKGHLCGNRWRYWWLELCCQQPRQKETVLNWILDWAGRGQRSLQPLPPVCWKTELKRKHL